MTPKNPSDFEVIVTMTIIIIYAIAFVSFSGK
jgi:hypothetical protein